MKLWLSLIIGTFTFYTFAQENKKIRGRVFQNESTLENVFLQNITTKKSTLTNSDGYFSLKASIGDTLLFSRMGFVDYIKILNKVDIEIKHIKVKMNVLINELEEVNIQNNSEINAVSEGIIPRKIKKLSTNERRLHTAGDFKWIDLLGLLGGSLEVDPILNAINGRTKRLKRNIEVEKKIRNITILERYRDYLKEEMNLSQKEAQRIISLAGEDEKAQLIIESKNPNRIKMFLVENWIKYKPTE